jgi:phosphatidylinositol dimannoside acyltransferase
MDAGRFLPLAWRWAPRIGEPVVRGLMRAAADLTWLLRGRGVRRLEANLARVRPEAGRRELRQLSRAGMQSYLRYYAEVLTQPALTDDQVDARVRAVNDEWARRSFADGRTVVAALAHMGNWDLAGLWAQRNLAPVVTVAERLEPEEVFQEFLALREGAGVRIIPLGRGEGGTVFRELLDATKTGGQIIPLLADRDLSAGGVEVDLLGERARVAPGPAALMGRTGVDLCAIALTYERLTGERRRRAGSPWGLCIEFSDPITVDGSVTGRDRVAAATQAWVGWIGDRITQTPQDWHMLQRVFVADLDPHVDATVKAGDP